MTNNNKPLILGVTGASGLIYAVRALKFLLAAEYEIELVASKSTYMVWQADQAWKIYLRNHQSIGFQRMYIPMCLMVDRNYGCFPNKTSL